MKPYWSGHGCELYHGDSRDLAGELAKRATVAITDPVWPDGKRVFPDIDAWSLWSEVAPHLAELERLVVILGAGSDPRFLSGVPSSMPFVRACQLLYPRPSYSGPLIIDFDMAYVFGKAFANGDGVHIRLPGLGRAVRRQNRARWLRPGGGIIGRRVASNGPPSHPCPRHPDHVRWLVRNFSRPTDIVIDPFAGSGTTLMASIELGRKSIGIELEEQWCEEAARILEGVPEGLSLAEARHGKQTVMFGG